MAAWRLATRRSARSPSGSRPTKARPRWWRAGGAGAALPHPAPFRPQCSSARTVRPFIQRSRSPWVHAFSATDAASLCRIARSSVSGVQLTAGSKGGATDGPTATTASRRRELVRLPHYLNRTDYVPSGRVHGRGMRRAAPRRATSRPRPRDSAAPGSAGAVLQRMPILLRPPVYRIEPAGRLHSAVTHSGAFHRQKPIDAILIPSKGAKVSSTALPLLRADFLRNPAATSCRRSI